LEKRGGDYGARGITYEGSRAQCCWIKYGWCEDAVVQSKAKRMGTLQKKQEDQKKKEGTGAERGRKGHTYIMYATLWEGTINYARTRKSGGRGGTERTTKKGKRLKYSDRKSRKATLTEEDNP